MIWRKKYHLLRSKEYSASDKVHVLCDSQTDLTVVTTPAILPGTPSFLVTYILCISPGGSVKHILLKKLNLSSNVQHFVVALSPLLYTNHSTSLRVTCKSCLQSPCMGWTQYSFLWKRHSSSNDDFSLSATLEAYQVAIASAVWCMLCLHHQTYFNLLIAWFK